jgi:tripartite-type tricarboxylate transporter receptor subunit TctC
MRGATGTSFSLLALPVVLALSPGDAQAQAYPCKSVRFIVPAAPGGTTDIMARELAQKMGESLGVQFLVDNRAGAAGIIGTDLLVKSAPDGCTIIMGNIGPNAINASLYRKLPYDPVKDLAPVSQVISVTNVLAVHPSVPAKNLKELVALAKSRPGELTFSSPGTGQSPHLSGELFKAMTGTNIVHVPYKGSFPAMMDLVGGQVSMMFDNLPTAIPHIRTGRIRALGVTSAQRSPSLPELPTIAESGLPGYDVVSWFGVLAPAAVPRPLIERLHAEIVKALALPDVKERLAGLGAVIVASSPEQFAAYIRSEIVKWEKVVKISGARAE